MAATASGGSASCESGLRQLNSVLRRRIALSYLLLYLTPRTCAKHPLALRHSQVSSDPREQYPVGARSVRSIYAPALALRCCPTSVSPPLGWSAQPW
ncbi:hypothetical protein BDW22DRAFT_1167915 [Trametopsis cervina]|nr:hypothetical protein BDW22DRAFT_1167915 [Trametopsis cervina]